MDGRSVVKRKPKSSEAHVGSENSILSKQVQRSELAAVALVALALVVANHGEDPEGAAAALQLSVAAPALPMAKPRVGTWVQGGFGLSGGKWLVVSWPMPGKL